MVKPTQTIRKQQPMNCLSMFDYFVGFALRGLLLISYWSLEIDHLKH